MAANARDRELEVIARYHPEKAWGGVLGLVLFGLGMAFLPPLLSGGLEEAISSRRGQTWFAAAIVGAPVAIICGVMLGVTLRSWKMAAVVRDGRWLVVVGFPGLRLKADEIKDVWVSDDGPFVTIVERSGRTHGISLMVMEDGPVEFRRKLLAAAGCAHEELPDAS